MPSLRFKKVRVTGGNNMPIRIALLSCILALAGSVSADAGDSYGGFGPSQDSSTQPINADSASGSMPPGGDQTLPWLQPQHQIQQQDFYGNTADQPVASDTYDMDDEGGH
jgi:hypothetical protein